MKNLQKRDLKKIKIKVLVYSASPWQHKQKKTINSISIRFLLQVGVPASSEVRGHRESSAPRLQPIREQLAAVNSEGHQAEEDGDSDQRGRGWGGEELPVLDLTVPQHRQHEDQQWDHQAAHVQGHLHLVRGPRPPRCPPPRVLGDVTVQDAVMDQVQRGQGLSVILQQLTLIDQPDLLLLTRKVGPERSEVRGQHTPIRSLNFIVSVLVLWSLLLTEEPEPPEFETRYNQIRFYGFCVES